MTVARRPARPRLMRRRRARAWRAALAIALAAGSAGGCGGSGDDADTARAAAPRSTPSGFAAASAGRVTLAHPSGWLPVEPPEGWPFAAELRDGSRVHARVGVIRDVPRPSDADAGVVAAAVDTALRLTVTRYDRGPRRDLRVPGARDAVRVDYTYLDGPGAGEPAKGTDVVLVYGRGESAVVRITGRPATLPPAVVDQIVGTVTVVPGPGG
ncbi:hypothetical protein ABZ801_28050 [Actinomadura sp. NPDC047616]|uniref:hypothetical protein n=1 Tax=Actinomadura sp. NPDC047616 TaxID=3155914 RepID=UPI0033EC045B